MTYDESGALMLNAPFRARIKVALLKYASYIQDEAPGTAGHSARYRWAQQASLQPEMEASKLQPVVVMDGAVQGATIDPDDGDSMIDDAGLQSAVEGVVNKFV